jgi:electron transfer flavoprotein alpha subunit
MFSVSVRYVLRPTHCSLRESRAGTWARAQYALRRLQSTLAILEQQQGQLNHGSLSAVTAAQKLGGPVAGFIACGNVKAAAQEATKVAGLERVISVDNTDYDKVIFPWCF